MILGGQGDGKRTSKVKPRLPLKECLRQDPIELINEKCTKSRRSERGENVSTLNRSVFLRRSLHQDSSRRGIACQIMLSIQNQTLVLAFGSLDELPPTKDHIPTDYRYFHQE